MLSGCCMSVCPVCLSCLSCPACNVGVLWPNGLLINMKLGVQVGLVPSDIVLDGDPAPLPKKCKNQVQGFVQRF